MYLSSTRFENSAINEAQSFPKALKDFGYDFDEGGKLRKIDPNTRETTNEGYEFNVSRDVHYNQKRYEALGEVINQYVYELLEKEGLKRLPVPKDSDAPLELRSFIFADDEAFTNKKLMILIHGSGVVRAGQWARRLIINDNLNSGTQISYIRKAKQLGYGILVLNTNDNHRIINGHSEEIKGSADPHEHMKTVWDDYVRPSLPKDIAIVAHRYGGVCTVKFAKENPEEFGKHVFAVGFTDSVHAIPGKECSPIVQTGRNWVSSEHPLDTPVDCASDDVPCISAGHPVHEMTSWSCIESLFKFLEERYDNRIKRKD
ncbi:FAM172 family protein homolog CG10038 isoform X1 [Diachasma alloeum]|uniref:FAM172 family protein homolog CG10038 isoform X1 n=1 Tax=Diachasma alloeum TaxID=454923 RepID=UPI0007381EA0|nr:FAM172 family protein homolog CG10038 isoform X1 [Diachasma alloeum]